MKIGLGFDTKATQKFLDDKAKYIEQAVTDILTLLAQQMNSALIKQFSTEGSFLGTKWKPLAPATLESRRGVTAKILQDTGTLRKGTIAQVVGANVCVGFTDSARYGQYHQTGDGVPVRTIITVNDYLGKKFNKIINSELDKAVKK